MSGMYDLTVVYVGRLIMQSFTLIRRYKMRNALVLLVLLVLLSACGTSLTTKDLFTLGKVTKTDDGKAALVLTAETRINPKVLVPGEPIKVNFPIPEKIIEIDLKPVLAESLALPKGQSAWVGQLQGGNELFVLQIGDFVEAQLQIGEMRYRLRSIDAKTAVLEVFDGTRFREAPNDGIIDPNVTGKGGGASPDSSCQDPANRIDIMVLYTPASRDAAGGVRQVENQIAFAIGRTNLAYANSSATHRLNLVYTGVVTYTEPSGGVGSNALLADLSSTTDGILDTIHGVRDAVQADLVSLIYEVDDSSWCGWGDLQETANADTTDHRAFSVVQRSCAGSNLSFAHEIGHNLGAQHDRANAVTSTLGYNFGHIQPAPTNTGINPWRTVMSYSSPCSGSASTGSCTRVPWFSNPTVSRLGDVTGVALTATNPEHNVNAFAQNDGQVSLYRCLKGGTAVNVWMKDRWEDEGGEPEPATAGKAMWQSPYIWVRLSDDTILEHEHEHENPKQLQTNFVYVKLHNTGGGSESSNLELYYANASTNLNDSANWTLIGTQARTIAAGAVDVAKFDWSGIPGSGHFCLLARWNVDGTALAFTDVAAAVRADNDLVWRNVNVIGLFGSPDTKADFEMAGDREFHATYLMITTKPLSHRKLAWDKLASASIKIDPAMINEKKFNVTGMKQISKGEFEVPLDKEAKLIGPFILKPTVKTMVRLFIKSDPDAVKKASAQLANIAHYNITIMQIRADGVKLAQENPSALFEKHGLVIGGVSYTLQLPANQ